MLTYTPIAKKKSGGSAEAPLGAAPTTTPALPAEKKPSGGILGATGSFFGQKPKEPEKPANDYAPLKKLVYVPMAQKQAQRAANDYAPLKKLVYVPMAQKQAQKAASAPTAPPTPSEPPSLFSKAYGGVKKALGVASDAISDATEVSPEEAEKIGTKERALARTLSYWPSEFVRTLVPGVAVIQDNPELAAQVGVKELAAAVPGVLFETAKEFVKMPIQYGALALAGTIGQAITSGRWNGQVRFDIPGLGEIANPQFRAAARIEAGEDPVVVAMQEGANSIFGTLFFMDLATMGFRGRLTKVAEIRTEGGPRIPSNVLPDKTGPQIVKEMPAGPKDFGPKSFRLYEKPVITQPLPPSILARMQQQGIDLGPRFDANLPTYFRVSPGPKGTFVAQVMQVRPSYFSQIVRGFHGKPPKTGATPTETVKRVESSEGMNVDQAIRNGDIPASVVYKDQAAGILSKQYAQGRINDVALKLDMFQKGLGDKFKASLGNGEGLTLAQIEQAGIKMVDTAVSSGQLALPPASGVVPAIERNRVSRMTIDFLMKNFPEDVSVGAAAVARPPVPELPPDAVEVLHKQEVKLEDIEVASQNPSVKPPPSYTSIAKKETSETAPAETSAVKAQLEETGTATVKAGEATITARTSETGIEVSVEGTTPPIESRTVPTVDEAVSAITEIQAQVAPAATPTAKNRGNLEAERTGTDFYVYKQADHYGGEFHDGRYLPAEKAKAVDLDLPEGFASAAQFFIHRPYRVQGQEIIYSNSGWMVSDARTGLAVLNEPASTQKAAIATARERLISVGPENYEKAVSAGVKKFGGVPRPGGKKTQKEQVLDENVIKPRLGEAIKEREASKAEYVLDKEEPKAPTKSIEKKMRDKPKKGRTPSGSTFASSDRGAFVEGASKEPANLPASYDKVHPVEFPELVSIARELTGAPPEVRTKLGKALGYFKPGAGEGGKGVIRLRADQFGDVEAVSKLLAHEIGHLTDYLPDKIMKRGNLLGRLFTLRRFLFSTFSKELGAPLDLKKIKNEATMQVVKESGFKFEDYMESAELRAKLKDAVKAEYKDRVNASRAIKEDVIRQELQTVSDYWRPWDRELADPNFIAYRESAAELYADAISMLYNSPNLLAEMAPTFFRNFFEALDRKPEARDAYFEVQALLRGDRDVLVKSRREGVQQMFKEGEMKALELQRKKEAQYKAMEEDIMMRLKHELLDKNAAIIQRVAKLEKEGKPVNEDENPLYALEERNYLGGRVKAFADQINIVYQDLRKAGISWETFGETLFYERVAAGDRSEQANPRGITPAAATELLESIKAELGPEKAAILEQGVADFRAQIREVMDAAFEEGLYTSELYETMSENPAYATFRVLEHVEDQVSAKVFKSVGTLKDIQNPANSTILKTIATIKAIERNRVTRIIIDFLMKYFPKDVSVANKKFKGKLQEYVESGDPNKELILFLREGKVEGYYVDPYVKASITNDSISHNLATLGALRVMNSYVFRPLFITFSPGFQAFNLIRDFWRFWKNIPGMTLAGAISRYRQAVPMAKVRGFGINLDTASPKELAAYRELIGLEKEQVFSITFNDIILGRDEFETEVELILRKSGIEGFSKPDAPATIRQKAMKPFMDLLDLIKRTGDFIETLPKAAGYYEFLDRNGGKALTQEQQSYIRKYLGSPDFLAGGNLKPATNEIFLFSNAIAQGIRSDIYIMTNPKTRSGYWWKTAKINVVPKILMYLAALGYFGQEIKEIMDGASEYDKTNYIVVPLGFDAGTGKPVYFRVPADETGRLIGATFWKIMTASTNTQPLGEDLAQVFSFFAGQVPSLSPVIEVGGATAQFMSGQNPYDAFRGRNVLSEDTFKAGGWRATKAYLGWVFQQLGGGVFVRFYHEPLAPQVKGPTEQFIGMPILSNILGRFIRVSDYGETEELRNVKEAAEREEVRQRLADNDVVNEYLRKAFELPEDERGAVESELRQAIRDSAEPSKERAAREDRVIQRFRLGLVRGTADAKTDALLGASTNNQKAQILKEIQGEMAEEDFAAYQRELLKEGVITQDVINKLETLP